MIGPLLCMPLLLVNMGGEMIYILDQRLVAQSIDRDKSSRVLSDVVKSMFNESFLHALFRPQEIYSINATKEIFRKLSHSSIMRLNESSMEKLYDLMCMSFKQHIQCSGTPNMLLHVTLNHLDSIKKITNIRSCDVLIDKCKNMLFDTYGTNLHLSEWQLIKQTLSSFFHNKKVRVSLFLQNKLQMDDGDLNLLVDELPAGIGIEHGGIIRYYREPGLDEVHEDVDTDMNEQEVLDVESYYHNQPSTLHHPMIEFEKTYHTPLGLNLYDKTLEKRIVFRNLRGPSFAWENVEEAIKLQYAQLQENNICKKSARIVEKEHQILSDLIERTKTYGIQSSIIDSSYDSSNNKLTTEQKNNTGDLMAEAKSDNISNDSADNESIIENDNQMSSSREKSGTGDYFERNKDQYRPHVSHRDEINLLADLLGKMNANKKYREEDMIGDWSQEEKDAFSINLFADDPFVTLPGNNADTARPSSNKEAYKSRGNAIEIKSQRKTANDLFKDKGWKLDDNVDHNSLEGGAKDNDDSEEEDILALMDSVK